ncbi:WecB/TagA/CpsF family glycosyltransferase [Metaplanococcus flavidus]|uniref:N-acetylglucosaminyldiphosphoundecaprenol N-acetyl-beta-D-mannosaminyltransferase n=1 Tax=Metaplanococcus flavidus TaxID=569883 RepID=A0ABW3LAI8_9BACL
MPYNKVMILDIPISNLSLEDFLERIYGELSSKTKNIFIVTANPEIIMTAKHSPSYRKSVLQANYIVPDGSGIMLASKILDQPLAEKITGYDLFHIFLAHASEHKKTIYFFGSKEGVASKAALNALELYNDFKIAGTKNGYSGLGEDIALEIAETKPDFVFVGLGAPLQEQWIADYKYLFPHAVLMGVGGSFDVLSGNSKRAPQFWIKHNLEWLYRLLTQPIRGKRMMQLPLYLMLVFKQKWKRSRILKKENGKIL